MFISISDSATTRIAFPDNRSFIGIIVYVPVQRRVVRLWNVRSSQTEDFVFSTEDFKVGKSKIPNLKVRSGIEPDSRF